MKRLELHEKHKNYDNIKTFCLLDSDNDNDMYQVQSSYSVKKLRYRPTTDYKNFCCRLQNHSSITMFIIYLSLKIFCL